MELGVADMNFVTPNADNRTWVSISGKNKKTEVDAWVDVVLRTIFLVKFFHAQSELATKVDIVVSLVPRSESC